MLKKKKPPLGFSSATNSKFRPNLIDTEVCQSKKIKTRKTESTPTPRQCCAQSIQQHNISITYNEFTKMKTIRTVQQHEQTKQPTVAPANCDCNRVENMLEKHYWEEIC